MISESAKASAGLRVFFSTATVSRGAFVCAVWADPPQWMERIKQKNNFGKNILERIKQNNYFGKNIQERIKQKNYFGKNIQERIKQKNYFGKNIQGWGRCVTGSLKW